MPSDKLKKLESLRKKLILYENQLAEEMKGYRGVIHESAASEEKHNKVMVLRAVISNLKEEIQNIESR